MLATAFFSGCSTVVRIDSNPSGANVMVNGRSLGTTPIAEYQVSDPAKPVEAYFTLPGYFPEQVSQMVGNPPTPIVAQLAPRTLKRDFDIATQPSGAAVTLEGQPAGTTPTTLNVSFQRDTKNSPWIPQKVTVSKVNYQSESVVLTDSLPSVQPIALTLLKDEKVYNLTAVNADGAALNADVTLDGKVVGKTPYKLAITYQRADKSLPWPKFAVSVEIPGQYKPAKAELNYTHALDLPFRLEAVTEIVAKISSPEVVMTPLGATFKFIDRSARAMLRTSEDSGAITDLKQVTNFDRQDMRPDNRIQTISSFTITPDGQNVIFSLTETDEGGEHYSNLLIKRADDSSGGISRLTQGTRFYDTQPFIANDGSNYMVFTSNRGERDKPDVFRVTLAENRLTGGISRLTNDSRLNYLPTYGDSNRQLYYLSIEPSFPKAEPYISSIRFDGSLPTQLPVNGIQLNNTHPDKIYFVRIDSDSKKKQIYSITADGKLETALINQEDFRNSNCTQPYASADGHKILFVSDHTTDPKDKPNNDIYVVNSDGSNLQRLTYNESEDWQPMWSPAEEGVVFFLSTRGGATNIWRFKLVTGH